tara:strand:+ start:2595 stop:4169 length:1575 start_codon:yes stop_codon:yes gene_type:complete
MSKQRSRYKFPTKKGFLGENNADAQTEDLFGIGSLSLLRNYHIDGKGGLRKREGWNYYSTNAVDSTNAIQGLGFMDFGTPYLLAVAGTKVKLMAEADPPTWSDITGSATISSGVNNFNRFCTFHDGVNGNIIATDGTSNPWKWNGTGNIAALALTSAQDIQSFKTHLFAINTSDRATAIRYSDTGDPATWPSDNIFDCTRDSVGVGLALHSTETLLAFYENSIWRINFDYGGAGALTSFFTNQLVDGSIGCASRTSIVTSRGRTYFASQQGFHVIGDPARPAKYISRPLEGIWSTINKSRIQYIYAFERGEPWNEIVFMASAVGSNYNDIAFVYNTEIASYAGDENAWSIFEGGSNQRFNVGVNYIKADGKNYTIMGDYASKIVSAWGHDRNSTSYTDGATASVTSICQTGFMNMGYEGIKSIREVWLDLEVLSKHTFSIQVDGAEARLATNAVLDLGTDVGSLNYDFTLNTSILAAGGFAQARFKLTGNSRYFRFRLEENDATKPQRIESMHFLFVPKGMRIQ